MDVICDPWRLHIHTCSGVPVSVSFDVLDFRFGRLDLLVQAFGANLSRAIPSFNSPLGTVIENHDLCPDSTPWWPYSSQWLCRAVAIMVQLTAAWRKPWRRSVKGHHAVRRAGATGGWEFTYCTSDVTDSVMKIIHQDRHFGIVRN